MTLDDLGGWPGVLGRLVKGDTLTAAQAAAAMDDILAGNATSAQMASFVTALRLRGETVEEMAGLVRAMLARAEPVAVNPDLAGALVDTCGTGGDGSQTVNISTMAALVVAGAGVPVCKHGGRAASSAVGTADVLEALGVVIDLGPAGVARCVEEVGMGFCFAPRYHPAMRHAAPVRKDLGVATLFNFLGPLANPARARRQVVGVSDPTMAGKMLGVLAANGATRAMVVWGHDGLDELSTTCPSTVLSLEPDGRTRRSEVDPARLNLRPADPAALRGGQADANAAAVWRVLAGELGPHRDVVTLNAAAGLVVGGLAEDLEAGLERARAAVDDGSAAAVLEGLVRVSRAAAE